MRFNLSALSRWLSGASIMTAIFMAMPGSAPVQFGSLAAFADEEPPPAPPLPDDEIQTGSDESAPPPDEGGAPPPGGNADLVPLQPGEAVVTRFSHTVEEPDGEGQPVSIIDINGISASILDIRRPGEPPSGQHWIDEPQRMFVSAGEVGQVFGVTLAERKDKKAPDIFLSATAAFGLHRTGKAPGKTEWMAGMWGPDSGPGSIFQVSADTGFLAEKFIDVTLDGRQNTGASLGNIAHDKWHGRLFVSDLETGMIHALDIRTGEDLGHYDHGTVGRGGFQDSLTGQRGSLPPVAFDPSTSANIENCSGDFARTPECWNIADFRRRVWGLDVRRGSDDEVRLYYSVWGSDAFGNPSWAAAGDDRRNSVWSIALSKDGQFDEASVRREFMVPGFWPLAPAMGDKAGNSNAVSDIVFPDCGPQDVMLVSERGGMRNLGLDKVEAFANPYQSRVLRYERGSDGVWQPKGRYDVGFHDRSIKDGDPAVFASAAGGSDFSYGLTEDGVLDAAKPSQSVWMTGDGLCSPDGPCTGLATGEHDDDSQVHGVQGSPADAFGAIDSNGNQDTGALDRSYMIDTDVNLGADGAVIPAERMRNDATRIGDISIYQVCEGAAPLIEPTGADELPPGEPPEDWPVHTLRMSHDKWASSGHRVQRSWHRREGSWHSVDRSWHWKSQSYHSRSQSWHWRGKSAHAKDRSWHNKGQSLHDKRYSWHARDNSWHFKGRSYHNKIRSWDNSHAKGKSFHVRSRTWSGEHNKLKSYHVKIRSWSGQHTKGKSYHVKTRSWNNDHVKGRSVHNRNKTWGDDKPRHVKGQSYHNRNKTWGNDKPDHVKGRSSHTRNRTWDDNRPDHNKAKSNNDHVKGRSSHDRGKTWGGDKEPQHSKKKSDADNKPQHSKKKSDADNKPQHSKKRSDADNKPQHSKKRSDADNKPQHSKKRSDADNKPQHSKKRSDADNKPQHSKKRSDADNKPQHSKKRSDADNKPKHEKQKSDADNKPKHKKKKSQADNGGEIPPAGKKKRVHNKDTSEFVVPS